MSSPELLRLLPTGAEGRSPLRDATVFQRYEYKYTIPARLMAPIRAFLLPYCDLDPYAAREPEGFYTITTLYLDSDGYKTFRDKEEEAPQRYKLRVRTYGAQADGPVKFEIKRRFLDVFRKSRVGVPRKGWPSLITRTGKPDLFPPGSPEQVALEEFLRLVHTIRAAPKVLVRYERQAFVSRIDGYARVSFDRRLHYQPSTSWDLSGRPGAWCAAEDPASFHGLGDQIILELKFMNRAPLWLVDLVRRFGLMRRGFSKYCFAVGGILSAGKVGRELAAAVPASGGRRR
jgi:hypothetical protein